MNFAIVLTSSRLIIALFFSFFFIKAAHNNLYTANKVFLLLAIACAFLIEMSDAIDGVIARSRNEVTSFGKIFDPVCDSISRQTIFCTFMYTGIIPLWMFFIFLYRDALMSFIRIMCAVNGAVIAARLSGKLKAIFQAMGTGLVLVVVFLHTYVKGLIPETWWGMHPGFWIMVFPTLFTALSMFDYLIPNWHVIKKMMEPER